jgi:hypothetical protein
VPADRATTLFGRIHVDLIPFRTADTGERYILHILDDLTRMNFAYTMESKQEAPGVLRHFARMVYRQWGFKMKIIRVDGETSLKR